MVASRWPPAIVPGGRHQALDLGVGQVFPRLFSVRPTPWHLNCSIYDGWRGWIGGQFHHDLQWPLSNDCSQLFTNSFNKFHATNCRPHGGASATMTIAWPLSIMRTWGRCRDRPTVCSGQSRPMSVRLVRDQRVASWPAVSSVPRAAPPARSCTGQHVHGDLPGVLERV